MENPIGGLTGLAVFLDGGGGGGVDADEEGVRSNGFDMALEGLGTSASWSYGTGGSFLGNPFEDVLDCSRETCFLLIGGGGIRFGKVLLRPIGRAGNFGAFTSTSSRRFISDRVSMEKLESEFNDEGFEDSVMLSDNSNKDTSLISPCSFL